jgi:hypothetical protein
LAAVLFLFDVAVRRVAPDFERMGKYLRARLEKLRGHEVAPPADYMEKLRSRKAEVDDEIERGRAATRFEPPPVFTGTLGEPLLEPDAPLEPKAAPSAESRAGLAPSGPAPEVESYTSRLLRAKQKVWEERGKQDGQGDEK